MANTTYDDLKGSDIIDVRDIIARVEELREERQDLVDQLDDADESMIESLKKEIAEWEEGNNEELETLEAILSDLCGNGGDEQWEGDWYPVTLIKDSYFEESMDDMVADCYDMPKNLPSFMTVTIDYDMLKQDYSEVEFDGDTYYYR